MANNDFGNIETPDNYEQKTICCFVVDVSGSMYGEPIKELNQGLKLFHDEILNDSMQAKRLEVAVVEFSSEVKTVVEASLPHKFSMPTLTTKGSTRMVDGVREAITLVTERKDYYKKSGQPYLRPWIILITDGAPDGDQDVDGLEREIEAGTKGKNFVFLPIAVSGADMVVLNKISGYKSGENGQWVKMPALGLKGLKFSEFFRWLSASMSVISASSPGDQINLPDPSEWQTFTI
jgi:uncharacterized protein YegL